MKKITTYIFALQIIFILQAVNISASEELQIPKMEYVLNRVYKNFQSVRKISESFIKEKKLIVVNGKIKVEVLFKNKNDVSKINFQYFGVEYDDFFGIYKNIVQMLIPVENLKSLSENQYVAYIRIPVSGKADIISEGVSKINADEFHNSGYTGKGAKIAVIDLGFLNYESLLGTELPNNAIIRSFYNSTSGNGSINGDNQPHGTAVAEIVYDVAPDALLYLININSLIELDKAVKYCRDQGVDIINHSVAWLQNSFYDGNGPVSSIAEDAFESGILWVNSSGNYRKKHYQGNFSDPEIDNWHNFSGNDPYLEILNVKSNDTVEVNLTWNEWEYSSNDYDLYLYYDDNGTKILKESGKNTQTGTQNPNEYISYTTTEAGKYFIAVKNEKADGKAILNIISSTHELEFISSEKSYSSSIVDPAASLNTLAVGATIGIQNTLAPFSSEGPANDGRLKPDLCAPSNVSTVTYGIFGGTSSSSPHVAGAAALLFERNPNLTNAELKDLLEASTIDLGYQGKDNAYGSGLLSLSLSTSITDNNISLIPKNWELDQNFPNPFNSETSIKFTTPKKAFLSLKIYSITGKEIRTLIYGIIAPGSYIMKWNGQDNNSMSVSSGIYYYELKSNDFYEVKKMILLQ